jgi:prepilin-type processing-associated H-X9-DG protein
VCIDCCLGALSSTYTTAFDGHEVEVGLRHAKGKAANVVFADGHASTVIQPILRNNPSAASNFNSWYFEYQGSSYANRAKAGAAKEPRQTLVWNFRHP